MEEFLFKTVSDYDDLETTKVERGLKLVLGSSFGASAAEFDINRRIYELIK